MLNSSINNSRLSFRWERERDRERVPRSGTWVLHDKRATRVCVAPSVIWEMTWYGTLLPPPPLYPLSPSFTSSLFFPPTSKASLTCWRTSSPLRWAFEPPCNNSIWPVPAIAGWPSRWRIGPQFKLLWITSRWGRKWDKLSCLVYSDLHQYCVTRQTDVCTMDLPLVCLRRSFSVLRQGPVIRVNIII